MGGTGGCSDSVVVVTVPGFTIWISSPISAPKSDSIGLSDKSFLVIFINIGIDVSKDTLTFYFVCKKFYYLHFY